MSIVMPRSTPIRVGDVVEIIGDGDQRNDRCGVVVETYYWDARVKVLTDLGIALVEGAACRRLNERESRLDS